MCSRIHFLIALAVTLPLGLASRSVINPSAFLRENAGDALWALAVLWGFGLFFPKARSLVLAGLAVAASFTVEVSQLFSPAWLESLRATRLGELVLGHGFLWIDLVRYLAGVAIGWGILSLTRRKS